MKSDKNEAKHKLDHNPKHIKRLITKFNFSKDTSIPFSFAENTEENKSNKGHDDIT